MRARRYLWSLLAVLAPIAPACAEMVRDWQNSMYYPARVVAVHWDSGRLDARSGVKFGAWTVRFGTPIHFAHYVQGLQVITISGDNPDVKGRTGSNVFRCRNAAVGERLCDLSFNLNASRCSLNIWMTGWIRDNAYIDIPCPTALDLAQ